MKRILFFLLVISFTSRSQSFYKGATVLDAGGGFEIWNTKMKISNSVTGRDTTQFDKAGNSHYYISGEYGLDKRFGLGLTFQGNKYFVAKDTSKKVQPTVNGFALLLNVNVHPVVRNKFDLVLGGNFGFSKINFNTGDSVRTIIWGKGMAYNFYVNPRFYFGALGINFKIYAPFFLYPKLASSNPNFTKDQSYKFSGIPAWGFNLGLQFNIFEMKGIRGENSRKRR
jgi:hypothetical protein